jgi:dolichyl-phosphate-mannose-protein mannosyltransferase
VLLAVLCACSLGARAAWLGLPCDRPCTTVAEHRLVFDEVYYVNAARVIDGIRPQPGEHYRDAPLGDDPNAEHPQLGKLIIAGSILLFGDDPWGWRAGSLLFGTLALVALFALVRAAGGGDRLALAATGLMAADNLLLVHGRLGTLDIFVLAFMLAGGALYLRGRPLGAGLAIGVGACVKLVSPYALLAFALLELLRLRGSVAGARSSAARAALRRLGAATATAGLAYLALLSLLDRLVPPWDPETRSAVAGGALGHTSHMLRYAAALTSPGGPRGYASYPWAWWADYKPLIYSDVGISDHAKRAAMIAPSPHLLGVIDPVILMLALPALWLAGRALARAPRRRLGWGGEVDAMGIAWTIGIYAPFLLASLLTQRTEYLYYMVVVMPGVYVLVARLLTRDALPRWALRTWLALLALSVIVLYPFTPTPLL